MCVPDLYKVLLSFPQPIKIDILLPGLITISVLVPVLGFGLLAAVLWFWYPLHKKQVDANVAALEAKHKAE